MKQILLSIFFSLILFAAFSQTKPKTDSALRTTPRPGKVTDSAVPKAKDTTPVKVYFWKTSNEQMKALQGLFQEYNADDLTDQGKYKAWQAFLGQFAIDSTYKPKK
jgi:hypothetical protein